MKNKIISAVLCSMIVGNLSGFALPPSVHPPKPESKFVPDMGFRSWQERRERMDDVVDDLNGSKPIRSIRSEVRKTMKETHAFMKDIHELDAREAISSKKKNQYQEDAVTLANRFEALANSLRSASISPEASVKQSMKWKETRKQVLTQLEGAQTMLEDTAASMDKLDIEE